MTELDNIQRISAELLEQRLQLLRCGFALLLVGGGDGSQQLANYSRLVAGEEDEFPWSRGRTRATSRSLGKAHHPMAATARHAPRWRKWDSGSAFLRVFARKPSSCDSPHNPKMAALLRTIVFERMLTHSTANVFETVVKARHQSTCMFVQSSDDVGVAEVLRIPVQEAMPCTA